MVVLSFNGVPGNGQIEVDSLFFFLFFFHRVWVARGGGVSEKWRSK